MAKANRKEGEHTVEEVQTSSDLGPALLALLEFIGEQIANQIILEAGDQKPNEKL